MTTGASYSQEAAIDKIGSCALLDRLRVGALRRTDEIDHFVMVITAAGAAYWPAGLVNLGAEAGIKESADPL